MGKKKQKKAKLRPQPDFIIEIDMNQVVKQLIGDPVRGLCDLILKVTDHIRVCPSPACLDQLTPIMAKHRARHTAVRGALTGEENAAIDAAFDQWEAALAERRGRP